jgi:glycosyltransferase involved in cell wall biosynthesis
MAVTRDVVAAMRGRRPTELRVAFVGTYPPRRCGIATFTSDLADAVATHRAADARSTWTAGERLGPSVRADIAAVDSEDRDFPPEVRLQWRSDIPADYFRAADQLNRGGYDVVSLQHEFGIYGGPDGEWIVDMLDHLRLPVVTTLHTVLADPSDRQRRIVRALAQASRRVVVLSRAAAQRMPSAYGIDPSLVRTIPHGVPDMPYVDPNAIKPDLGLAGHPTVLSFGLLGPGKGYELVIRAMADVVRDVPNACYVILGATHPQLLRHEGEVYRNSLQVMVKDLGLVEQVRFVNEYVDLPALERWLLAADVFVTPYPGVEQVVSGTLAYALAAGKALVSTPYAYAKELLAEGRGRLVPFGDSLALGGEIRRFLLDPKVRDDARRLAYRHGRSMTWPTVGAEYRHLFEEVIAEGANRHAPIMHWPDPGILVTGDSAQDGGRLLRRSGS